jgi:hypothetical protein
MKSPNAGSTISARLRIVDEHVSLENAHDLNGIMGTLGETKSQDNQPAEFIEAG